MLLHESLQFREPLGPTSILLDLLGDPLEADALQLI
jgi:hypothetical protein